ncbi:MAG: hypothetical protein FJX74_26115 [Armatimonadetes bacterium]|nr:hypothetical protein [Armatimonadota bacterium]
MFAVAAIVLLSNDPATAGGSAFWVALSTIVVGAVGYLVADMCLYLGFRRAPFDAQQIAATVERLIRLCSQYGEHAAERVGDRFEFELRLAEAEGALRTYRELFRHEAVTGRFTTAA